MCDEETIRRMPVKAIISKDIREIIRNRKLTRAEIMRYYNIRFAQYWLSRGKVQNEQISPKKKTA